MPNLPTIVAIGAGNIASHIIPALSGVGCRISQVYSRKIFKARRLANRVGAEGINSIAKINTKADWYLIMVADDGITDVIGQLPEVNKEAIISHTSGATGSEVLRGISNNFGSFYALQSFKTDQALDLNQTPFLLNANNTKTLRTMRVIARQISNNVYDASDEERLMYHLSAIYANNFTNHMACIADQILSSNDLNPDVLRPIMESTFEKILNNNPCLIQTGPAIRKDVKLQERHLKLIDDNEQWSKIYKVISESISKSNSSK